MWSSTGDLPDTLRVHFEDSRTFPDHTPDQGASPEEKLLHAKQTLRLLATIPVHGLVLLLTAAEQGHPPGQEERKSRPSGVAD